MPKVTKQQIQDILDELSFHKIALDGAFEREAMEYLQKELAMECLEKCELTRSIKDKLHLFMAAIHIGIQIGQMLKTVPLLEETGLEN